MLKLEHLRIKLFFYDIFRYWIKIGRFDLVTAWRNFSKTFSKFFEEGTFGRKFGFLDGCWFVSQSWYNPGKIHLFKIFSTWCSLWGEFQNTLIWKISVKFFWYEFFFKQFIKVNIEDRIRKNIRRKITSGTATIDLFDDAKNAVFILIKRDSYKRFKQQYSTSASLETLKARWCFLLLGKSEIFD